MMPYLKEAKLPTPGHPELTLGPGVRAWPTVRLRVCILGSSLGKFSVALGSVAPKSIPVGMATVGELGLLGDEVVQVRGRGNGDSGPSREKAAEGTPIPCVRTASNVQPAVAALNNY